jgi:SAM-dependent methyltransferase
MDANDAAFWESNYRDARLNWDLGGPTPVFCALAEGGTLPPGRMIVLGAGLGHDARLFARHDFQVTALDFAPGAARAMRALQDPAHPIVILQEDFFALPPALDGLFDYVLEYVFYCAIDPGRRADYAGVVARLLRPGGQFIGLVFPTDERPGGPPFQARPEELAHLLAERGLGLEARGPHPATIKPRRGREELLLMRKRAGKGSG